MARRKVFPQGAASEAAYLAQLAHAVASGRARIASMSQTSDGASAFVGAPGAYECTVYLKLLDPAPDPYADQVPGHELEEHLVLAERQLERAFALLNPTKHEDVVRSEKLMMFVANKQAEMEGKIIRTVGPTKATIDEPLARKLADRELKRQKR